MASPILDQLKQQVQQTTGVEQSAITLINGIQAQIDQAVQAAMENGATAEELQPVSDLSNAMSDQTNQLAAAIQARGGGG